MDPSGVGPTTMHHVVAIPFPCQGHINSMMSLCKLLSSRRSNLLITFVVTEEWLNIIGSQPKPESIKFASIPNVVERAKAVDFGGFNELVKTQMEAPFERVLDRLQPPVTRLLGDFELHWATDVGTRRNIPVASFWSMSASFYSLLHHFYIFTETESLSVHCLGHGDKQIDHVPGITSTQLEDLQTIFRENDPLGMETVFERFSKVPQVQYLLLNSFYELEPLAFNSLQATFPFPVHAVGPAIRYLEIADGSSKTIGEGDLDYLKWLDLQPKESVLYIALGSFFVLSNAQMDEFVAALRSSGVRFLWVAREDAARLKDSCGDMGLIVHWCDQLRVLCHPSIGGFWSHCGWNSTVEAIYTAIPMLAFPLFFDQVPNSRNIVEDWKNGWPVKRANMGSQILVGKEAISDLVKRFMDPDSNERNETRKRARDLKNLCDQAITNGGSSWATLDAFIGDFLEGHAH